MHRKDITSTHTVITNNIHKCTNTVHTFVGSGLRGGAQLAGVGRLLQEVPGDGEGGGLVGHALVHQHARQVAGGGGLVYVNII